MEGVLYQGSVRFSCWDEQGKKCREGHAVLRRDYTVEIHHTVEVTLTHTAGCSQYKYMCVLPETCCLCCHL